MWQAWVLGGGLTATMTVLARVGYKLHKDAIAAHDKRADEWHAAWQAERAAREVREEQLGIVLSRPREPAS